jgi:hypothetical protein
MEKSKWYRRAKFSGETLSDALRKLTNHMPEELPLNFEILEVAFAHERWFHASDAEFFEDYRKDDARARFWKTYDDHGLQIQLDDGGTEVTVSAPDRATIHDVMAVFDGAAAGSVRPPKAAEATPCIFIGHGGDAQWRDLKDHLHEKHGYTVEAYEIGARAGHAIRDILGEMLTKSSFAILVMTAEDHVTTGKFHPRLNVVHEAGLFQGKLGFDRAVVLLEQGTEEFSNIAGIQQIRFAKGNIRETFGEVIATLRREFGRQ